MKLLMFYTHSWWHKPATKSLETAPELTDDLSAAIEVSDCVVVFFHLESHDEVNKSGVIEKFVKNTKWLAGKFKCKNVVLHSFNHLSTSKASAEFASLILQEVKDRLIRSGYSVINTPFGYFNEFKMHVAGDSLAKVYKEF